jgi:inorganic phosphate transporter, PiT family
MTDAAIHVRDETGVRAARPSLDRGLDPRTAIIFFLLLGAGLLFVAYSLYADVAASGTRTTTFLPYLLLFVALLIALGFEFVNGFHDTANAVATVIYTHSLPAEIAVVWSGVAAGTIAAADMYGLPVSTTHVLSSGVAGTMLANGSGLHLSTSATSYWRGC